MPEPTTARLRNLFPETVVSFATRLPLDDFNRLFGDTKFLLITLDDLSGGLTAGLTSLTLGDDAQLKATVNAIGFHTVVANVDESGRLRPGPPSAFSSVACRARLFSAPHYLMPLRKRAEEAAYMGRISVGRARNMDIVLRDSSVSKFHAWFQLDEHGNVQLADGGSKNGVKHNGTQLVPKQLVSVQPGDKVRIGTVDTTLCASDVLWNALNER